MKTKLPSGIPVPATDQNGQRVWRVYYSVAGKSKCRSFQDVSEAHQFQKELKVQFIQLGNTFDVLSPKQRRVIMTTLLEIEEHGTSLNHVWAFWKTQHTKPLTIADAWPKFLEAKRSRGLRPSTLKDFAMLEPFLEQIGSKTLVRLIKPSQIEDWASKNSKAPRSFIKLVRVASSFCGWLEKQGWMDENPAKRIELPKVDQRTPQILTNDQLRSCLAYAESKPFLKSFLLLAVYAGIRPTEICRLEWTHVCRETGHVKLDGDVTKTRRRRVVTMLGNSAEALFKTNSVSLCPDRYVYELGQMAKSTGISWQRDCLRHTAASHMVNVYKSMDEVALQLGNSPEVVRNHYLGLVTPTETEEFLTLV